MTRTLIAALVAGALLVIAVVVVVINNRASPDRSPEEIKANADAYKTKPITVGNYQN